MARSRAYPLANILSDTSPSMYSRPAYQDPAAAPDPFPVNGAGTSHQDIGHASGGGNGTVYGECVDTADGDAHVAPGSEGPVTVADIVRRPIVERRKRPIPRDPSRLVQINAPIPPRRSKRVFTTRSASEIHPEASTSQAGVEGHSAASDGAANVAEAHEAGLALQRGSKRKYKSSEQVDDAEAKRIRNTLAARRHRLYKATQWKNMQEEQERLRARNAELEEQAAQRPDEAMLTAENRALLSRVRQLEVERQALLVRIEQMEHHMRRTRHPGFY